MATSAQDVLRRLGEDGIERIDLKVSDLQGRWHSFGLEAHQFGEGAFQRGLCLDSPSLDSLASGLVLHPDPATAWIDPFLSPRSLSLIATFKAPAGSGANLRHCPRSLAGRALALLAGSGLADAARFGVTQDFFLFSELTWHCNAQGCGYQVATGTEPPEALGNELLLTLAALGLPARLRQPAPAAPLHGLSLRSDDLLRAADALMVSRYVLHHVARRHGWSATVLPRPTQEPISAGLAVHQSLWRAGQPLFCGEGTYGDLSQTARWYLGGLLHHGPSLAAFANPGANSYRRLRSGPAAPTRLTYARNDPSTVVAVPDSGSDPDKRRLVLRQADGLANPYLALAAMLMAGLDGVRRQSDPGSPSDLEPAAAGSVPSGSASLPTDLGGSLVALGGDHDYLLAGGVFSQELIEDWITLKRLELEELEHRPHPLEFASDPIA
ncbi:glutamine synthetase family protein [Cyanobium gracile]|uniref:glutamine synthetase n=1 Tax=Cyanobium gracile UHCC 0281 TaxID=3110309 RepID=A0ABU5SR45_9CYAN|nr:glutamine synthetase family protein [Cyanobium gracile]MEA5440976.1 glutamine synthetase family protein [Cyanobium gracile UHCC 0281]